MKKVNLDLAAQLLAQFGSTWNLPYDMTTYADVTGLQRVDGQLEYKNITCVYYQHELVGVADNGVGRFFAAPEEVELRGWGAKFDGLAMEYSLDQFCAFGYGRASYTLILPNN